MYFLVQNRADEKKNVTDDSSTQWVRKKYNVCAFSETKKKFFVLHYTKICK